MYEESLRMAFVMRFPKNFGPGLVEDDIILNVDFAPVLEGCTPPDWRSAMYYPGTLDELQDPEWELFDLHNDPYELDNLADEPEKAELLAGLKAELERAQVEVGDTPYVRV
ncbi:DUF4976 domain-containing protein [Colletotrichum asianum]